MKLILRRRIRNTLATLVIVVLLGLILSAQEASLQRSAFTSGYILLPAVLFLASYNLRKKLPFLPLGNSSSWMQLHIYIGWGTIAIFLMHVGFRLPSGRLECMLATLYSIVAGSGIYGLYMTRTIPRKLTAIRQEVIFEQIPAIRRQVSVQARALVLASSSDSPLFAEMYQNRLSRFFETPRSPWYYLHPNGQLRRKLIAELEDMNRYLSQSQRAVSQQLAALVYRKDDVDYHHALQGRLKVWLFAHVGFTYSLVAVSLLHAVLAHAFHGAMR